MMQCMNFEAEHSQGGNGQKCNLFDYILILIYG